VNDLQLPSHVINRLERRWAARLDRDATAWRGDRSIRPSRRIIDDGGRQIPVKVKWAAAQRRAEPAQPNA
jgi:hypothetical protein